MSLLSSSFAGVNFTAIAEAPEREWMDGWVGEGEGGREERKGRREGRATRSGNSTVALVTSTLILRQ